MNGVSGTFWIIKRPHPKAMGRFTMENPSNFGDGKSSPKWPPSLTSSKIEVGEFSSWWIYGYVRISLQVPSFYSMSVIASIHVKSKEIRMIGLNFLRCKYFQRPGHPLLRCPSSTIVANSILDFWDWGDDSGELWCFDGFDAMHFSLRLWLFCSILQVFHSVLWNFTWFYWEILGRCFLSCLPGCLPYWEDPHLESHSRGSGFFDANGDDWDRDTYCLRFDDAILEGYESPEPQRVHKTKASTNHGWIWMDLGGCIILGKTSPTKIDQTGL